MFVICVNFKLCVDIEHIQTTSTCTWPSQNNRDWSPGLLVQPPRDQKTSSLQREGVFFGILIIKFCKILKLFL